MLALSRIRDVQWHLIRSYVDKSGSSDTTLIKYFFDLSGLRRSDRPNERWASAVKRGFCLRGIYECQVLRQSVTALNSQDFNKREEYEIAPISYFSLVCLFVIII